MAMYTDEQGQAVLTNIPSPPPNFLNITNKSIPGFYIVGADTYFAKDFKIVTIFHRQIGSADEIVLGILLVFLIATFSELIQTVLLRTGRDRRVFSRNLFYATLIDDLSHFRNIWSNTRTFASGIESPVTSSRLRKRMAVSIIAISLTIILFTADVLAIFVTQPTESHSAAFGYNLLGKQPIGTSIGVSKSILRTTVDRGCVSPIELRARQRRNFRLNTCFKVEKREALRNEANVSGEISVGSWYHRGGSDHSVTFEEAFYDIRMRSQLFANIAAEKDERGRRILFQNIDDENMSHALYIHRRFIHATMEWSCNREFSEKTCPEVLEDLREERSEKKSRNISMWRSEQGDVHENVTGLVSTFRLRINAPFLAVENGIHDLVTSAVIEESNGPGQYERLTDDEYEDGIRGLLSEYGRGAGVVLICTALAGLLSVLFLLRWICKPFSLALMASNHMSNENWVVHEKEAVPNGDGVVGVKTTVDDEYKSSTSEGGSGLV